MTDTQTLDAPEVTEVEPTVDAVEATTEPDTPTVEDEEVEAVEETPAPIAPAPRTGNAAWADEADRNTVATIHAQLRAAGYTRPLISKDTGFSDSQVWRAQNKKVHSYELEAWLIYFRSLPRDADGNFTPAPGSRQAKPKVEDLQVQLAEQAAAFEARVARVIEVLGDEAKTTKQYRELVERAVEALTA